MAAEAKCLLAYMKNDDSKKMEGTPPNEVPRHMKRNEAKERLNLN